MGAAFMTMTQWQAFTAKPLEYSHPARDDTVVTVVSAIPANPPKFSKSAEHAAHNPFEDAPQPHLRTQLLDSSSLLLDSTSTPTSTPQGMSPPADWGITSTLDRQIQTFTAQRFPSGSSTPENSILGEDIEEGQTRLRGEATDSQPLFGQAPPDYDAAEGTNESRWSLLCKKKSTKKRFTVRSTAAEDVDEKFSNTPGMWALRAITAVVLVTSWIVLSYLLFFDNTFVPPGQLVKVTF